LRPCCAVRGALTSSLAAISLVFAAACDRHDAPRPSSSAPEIELHVVTMRQFRGNALDLVAQAPTVTLFRQSGELEASNATVFLPASEMEITANRITGNAWQSRLTGDDGVTFRSTGGAATPQRAFRGTTPRATFDRSAGAQGTASSDAGISLVATTFSLQAREFEVDFATQHATFIDASTNVPPSDGAEAP
jgi:hypothetical protein